MKVDEVKARTSAGLADVRLWLALISQTEPALGAPVPLELKIMRGLYFVQLYAVVERTVLDTMSAFIRAVNILQPKYIDIDSSFYVIAMAKDWKSVKDRGYKKVFHHMKEFFATAHSDVACNLDESIFSLYLQNIWADTIAEIFLVLGLNTDLELSKRLLLNELVDNRNKIAHGRESALEIGARYSTGDLYTKFTQVQEFVFEFVAQIEGFYDERLFLLAESRPAYI